MNKLQKLPIGIQTFNKIREGNYLYIDKTQEAYELINSYQYIFLSRPRRFGKSLFLDTLKNIFEGNKEYFKDLYIYDKWDWDTTYPVIKIDFFGDLRSVKSVKKNIIATLKSNQQRLDVECDDIEDYGICFAELIKNIYTKYDQKVVVLIDEYDKAILDNLDQMEVAIDVREIIKGLYSVLKGCDQYLQFVFLTGVSKFSKASIFSGLNMLTDISLDERFGNICGYTQDNIENEFKDYLIDVDLIKVKEWYNGYNFLKDPVYNPFDILLFISKNYKFSNYWFSTGTPTFLIKLIKQNNYFLPNLVNITVGEKLLDSFDIENIELEVILYQAGYLTIDKQIEKRRGGFEYKLKVPNKEVQISLSDTILDYLTNQKIEKQKIQDDLYDALYDNDMILLESALKSIFASIPYNNYVNNTISNFEGYYASVIFTYLQSLGFNTIAEDVTNKGRIDLTIKTDNFIYILEFKVGKEDALSQIKDKNYAQKYLGIKKDIYLLGINFDDKEKNISKFNYEIAQAIS